MNLFAEAKKVLDKDGKVNALGPYGKQKLTGKEVSQYFKKNKVSDPQVKKAVEVALDLGGADTVARQEIKKFYGDKILKSKEVQNALRHANEETIVEKVSYVEYKFKNRKDAEKAMNIFKSTNLISLDINDDNLNGGELAVDAGKKDMSKLHKQVMSKFRPKIQMSENIQKVVKMFPRDMSWKKLVMKHRRAIDDFRKNNKDLPAKVEDDLLMWGFDNGEIRNEDDAERFIEDILNEKFKPYIMKGYERVTDFYVQFRGGRGDRITSPENKKDFETAKKLITAYGKKHKLNIKDSSRQKIYGTPQEGSSAYKISLYAKHHTNDPNHDLAPLLAQIAKLKTAEDHGGGNAKPIKEETISEGKNLVPAIKNIVDKKGAAKVGGVMIDMFTASMISQIYDKVNDQNKKRMENSNIQTLVNIAQKMMQKNSVNEETLVEGYSKKMSDKEIGVIAKKYNMGQDEMDDYKNQYSPAKIGKGSSWLAITYPVKDGEYYFAFISKDEKKNVKYNDLLNKELKKLYKKHLNTSGKRGSTNLADAIWDDLPEVMKGFPRDLGWNDTMTREEIWGAITNMSGLREDMEESKVLIGKMRLGKRKKAPKFEGANPAQQAAIAISKKEKAGKPGYDKEGKSLKKESIMDTYRQMWEDAQNITEVSDKEINAMKKVSKDMQKVLVSYQKIANMGDKELKNTKHNYDYEQVLKARDTIVSMIGKLQTRQTIEKSMKKEDLEEKLSKADLKMIDMMYDKKGNLTDVGKAVMNYKPGDNIRKIVQNLNNKK